MRFKLVELKTNGGKQQVRIFSLRGCHLLGMLAKTKEAKAFRVWVLDVLEKHTQAESSKSKPYGLKSHALPLATKQQRQPLVKAVRQLVATAKEKGKTLTYEEAHSMVNMTMGVKHIEKHLNNTIEAISCGFHRKDSFKTAIQYQLRRVTGIDEFARYQTKHLPIITNELNQIIETTNTLQTMFNEFEAHTIKLICGKDIAALNTYQKDQLHKVTLSILKKKI